MSIIEVYPMTSFGQIVRFDGFSVCRTEGKPMIATGLQLCRAFGSEEQLEKEILKVLLKTKEPHFEVILPMSAVAELYGLRMIPHKVLDQRIEHEFGVDFPLFEISTKFGKFPIKLTALIISSIDFGKI